VGLGHGGSYILKTIAIAVLAIVYSEDVAGRSATASVAFRVAADRAGRLLIAMAAWWVIPALIAWPAVTGRLLRAAPCFTPVTWIGVDETAMVVALLLGATLPFLRLLAPAAAARRSLGASIALAAGAWFKLASLGVILWLMVFMMGKSLHLGIESAFDTFGIGPLSAETSDHLEPIAMAVMDALVTPVEGAAFFLAYVDQRVRREGLDIEALLAGRDQAG
jgi:hypothetical protein